MNIGKVFNIKELAQEFMDVPKIERKGEDVTLMYDYETDSGEYKWTGITFLNALKYKQTNDNNISEYMLKAYNSVVEIKDSLWLEEVVSDGTIENGKFKHYLVYFDGYGAYEFLSTCAIQGIK